MNQPEIDRLQALPAYRDGKHPDHDKVIDALVQLYNDQEPSGVEVTPADEPVNHRAYAELRRANRR